MNIEDKTVAQLRAAGHLVVAWRPEELHGVAPSDVEWAILERGNAAIEDLKAPSPSLEQVKTVTVGYVRDNASGAIDKVAYVNVTNTLTSVAIRTGRFGMSNFMAFSFLRC